MGRVRERGKKVKKGEQVDRDRKIHIAGAACRATLFSV